MNVFVVGTPFETAKALDSRRLNKQIIECRQILKAISGESKAWANHPATLQYKNHVVWLTYYTKCLEEFKGGFIQKAEYWNNVAKNFTPDWHCEDYLNQMKRRLYTKDSNFYSQWKDLGTSEVNWYFINNTWKYYKNGKVVEGNV